jgi:hypothetical protein
MATKAEVNAVYAAGLIQGITLVTFPALSTIFTSTSEYGLSNTQYGTMFLPQVITAVTGSLLGGKDSGEKTSTSSPAPSKRDGQRSGSSTSG